MDTRSIEDLIVSGHAKFNHVSRETLLTATSAKLAALNKQIKICEKCGSPHPFESGCSDFGLVLADVSALAILKEDFGATREEVNKMCYAILAYDGVLKQKKSCSKYCLVCNNVADFKCSKCLQAFYCSEKCQRENWKTHKLVCEPFAKTYDKQ